MDKYTNILKIWMHNSDDSNSRHNSYVTKHLPSPLQGLICENLITNWNLYLSESSKSAVNVDKKTMEIEDLKAQFINDDL